MRIQFFLGFVMSLLFQSATAQKVIINGKEGLRALQWSDFTGTPDESNPYFANTHWNTTYRYTGVRFAGDAVFISGFEFTLELVPKGSWVKAGKQSEALLRHEQGHFNTGLLFMKEVLQKMAAATFTRTNYQAEVKELVASLHKKYDSMNQRYDAETDHSLNREEQQKWETYFATALQ